MRFQALIDSIHFDPKKGAVKIVLIGASHISLDELTTLSPKDETIQVTLESDQTKLEQYPEEYAKAKEEEEIREQERIAAGGVAIEPGSQEERELEEGRIITEFPTSAAEEEGDPIPLDEEAVERLKEAAERLESDEEKAGDDK